MATVTKSDAVAANRIWAEHVHKENSTITLNERFAIPDPRRSEAVLAVFVWFMFYLPWIGPGLSQLLLQTPTCHDRSECSAGEAQPDSASQQP
jgi:hypothetical protein